LARKSKTLYSHWGHKGPSIQWLPLPGKLSGQKGSSDHSTYRIFSAWSGQKELAETIKFGKLLKTNKFQVFGNQLGTNCNRQKVGERKVEVRCVLGQMHIYTYSLSFMAFCSPPFIWVNISASSQWSLQDKYAKKKVLKWLGQTVLFAKLLSLSTLNNNKPIARSNLENIFKFERSFKSWDEQGKCSSRKTNINVCSS